MKKTILFLVIIFTVLLSGCNDDIDPINVTIVVTDIPAGLNTGVGIIGYSNGQNTVPNSIVDGSLTATFIAKPVEELMVVLIWQDTVTASDERNNSLYEGGRELIVLSEIPVNISFNSLLRTGGSWEPEH